MHGLGFGQGDAHQRAPPGLGFERHGGAAVTLAQFVPIVRTFVTMIAGVGRMTFQKFITYTAIGGILWVLIAVQAGYFLGQIPVVRNNFEAALLLIIVVSVLPMGVEWLKARRKGQVSQPQSARRSRVE